jgi:hypothetical protein
LKPVLDWKNAFYDLYTEYVKVEECPSWFVQFARDGGFDDEYSYYVPKNNAPVVKRRPLWMGKSKKIPTEKHHPFRKGKQLELLEAKA